RRLVLVRDHDPAVACPAADLLEVELHALADRVAEVRVGAGRRQDGADLEVGTGRAARRRRRGAAAGGQGERAGGGGRRGGGELEEVAPGEAVTRPGDEIVLSVSAHRPALLSVQPWRGLLVADFATEDGTRAIAMREILCDRICSVPRPRPTYPIASVDNALRLLLLVAQRSRLRLSEASEALGVAPSTAHRLLAMLVFHDLVRQEDRYSYVTGPARGGSARPTTGETDLRLLARPAIEQLAAATDETVHLALLEGRMVRYLDGVESTRALRMAARTGRTVPAHYVATGKALLA